MIKELKDFLFRGNVLDLAVALGKKEEATEEAAAPSQEELLAEIRDLLANK